MNYRVLGVEYLTVSDSLPNQAHLHEELRINQILALEGRRIASSLLGGKNCLLNFGVYMVKSNY